MNTDFNTRKWGCCCYKYLKMWKWFWNWIMSRGCKNFGTQDRKVLDLWEYPFLPWVCICKLLSTLKSPHLCLWWVRMFFTPASSLSSWRASLWPCALCSVSSWITKTSRGACWAETPGTWDGACQEAECRGALLWQSSPEADTPGHRQIGNQDSSSRGTGSLVKNVWKYLVHPLCAGMCAFSAKWRVAWFRKRTRVLGFGAKQMWEWTGCPAYWLHDHGQVIDLPWTALPCANGDDHIHLL